MGLSRTSNLELVTLPNCDGLRENGTCRWLSVPACIGPKCPFCSSTDSLEKAYERLCSLDEETQQRIAKKYYGGFRPWRKAGERRRGERGV